MQFRWYIYRGGRMQKCSQEKALNKIRGSLEPVAVMVMGADPLRKALLQQLSEDLDYQILAGTVIERWKDAELYKHFHQRQANTLVSLGVNHSKSLGARVRIIRRLRNAGVRQVVGIYTESPVKVQGARAKLDLEQLTTHPPVPFEGYDAIFKVTD